ncbi:MAG: hypothetical protein WCH65_01225 [bacterium]
MALTGSVFADDCNLILTGNLGEIKNYESFGYSKVVPKEALTQALTNLKAYCCTRVVPSLCSKEEKNNLPKLYPKSAYFFDQLLDVTMRRLDGVQNLAYGLPPDPAGKQRREYITKVANDPNGAQAIAIETTYKTYRKIHPEYTKDSKKIADKYDGINSETLSLGDKYNTLCTLIKNVYEETQNNTTIIGGKYENNSFYNKCENLVVDRVSKENSYVKLLMIKKSSQLMDEATKAYTKKYFVEEKLMALRNLIAKVKDTFKTIVQQAAASKSCSK